MIPPRLQRGRPASLRSAALAAAVLLGGCEPTPEPTSPPAAAPTQTSRLATATASPPRTVSPEPSASASARGGAWAGRVVVRYADGAFGVAGAAGVRPLHMPRGAWWLGTGASIDSILLLPGDDAEVDAVVGRVVDGAVDVKQRIGSGQAPAGAGCLSGGGAIALADASTLQLALLDGRARRPIELGGHGTLGECAWLTDDALVAPAEHDHALLYFHRFRDGHGEEHHAGDFGDVAGRYPSAAPDRMALTTGDADDESIDVWSVGRIVDDGSTAPRLSPLARLRPGDGPRRGVHAVSGDGRCLVAAGEDDGSPWVFVYAVGSDGAEEVARLELPNPVDDLAVLSAC